MRKILSDVVSKLVVSKNNTFLKVGDTAPDFSGKDESGNTIRLSDFKGKKVVLYFYPKDGTLVCTAEACNLRDNYNGMLKSGYVVLGVSPDDMASHQKFKAEYKLPFSLIADTDVAIAKAYGVWGAKSILGKKYEGMYRTTFVIDESGVITEVIFDVDSGDHANQIMNKED
jgi:peroxiredoxin Q/BCP